MSTRQFATHPDDAEMPSTGRPTTIQDAGPAVAPDRPPLSPEETFAAGLLRSLDHAFRTMRAFDRAAKAVERHEGPREGPEYAAKITRWQQAYADWRKAMKTFSEERA